MDGNKFWAKCDNCGAIGFEDEMILCESCQKTICTKDGCVGPSFGPRSNYCAKEYGRNICEACLEKAEAFRIDDEETAYETF
jgi:hypothetical protein